MTTDNQTNIGNDTLEALVLECVTTPELRKNLFNKIGQEYLISLHGRKLEEKTFEVFQLMLKHEKEWKGSLMLPEFYRQDKVGNSFKDIWYTVRDFFAWCILYPQEVDLHFRTHEDGKIELFENPKIRIVEKDNIKQVYKTELGKRLLVPVKKERTFEIPSGFNLGQKDSILNVCIVGLIAPVKELNINREKIKGKAKKVVEKEEEIAQESTHDFLEEKPKEIKPAKKKTVKKLKEN